MFQETPPANDDFTDAQVVGPGLPISLAASDAFSTVEPGEPHHASNNETDFPPHDSVWYSWTAGASAEIRVRVCENDFGARLGVYTGATVGGLTRVTTSVPLVSFPYCSLRFAVQSGDHLPDRRQRRRRRARGKFQSRYPSLRGATE